MLEKMGSFFETRLKGYEEHQLTSIEAAREFYPFTAGCLPQAADPVILDLGCGTGLELGYYFETVPTAKVTGIDLARGMLDALRSKFPKPGGFLILTDYFAASDEEERFRRAELLRLKQEQGIRDDELYHYDTPLTVDHEREALLSVGFSSVTVLKSWGPTSTLKAVK